MNGNQRILIGGAAFALHLTLAAFSAAQTSLPALSPATQPTSAPSSQAATHPASAPTSEPTTVPADDPLRSPWSTMKVFLIRVSEAETDTDRIGDAMACLDLGRLEPDEIAAEGPKLARMLEEVIAFYGLNLELIPDDWASGPYIFYRGEPGEVVLERQPDARWRFTAETVATLPKLYHTVRKAATTQKVEVDASIPAEHRSARATMATFRDAIERGDRHVAAQCIDLANVKEDLRESRAEKLGVLIPRIRDVVLPEIPDEPVGLPYKWYTGQRGSIELARQEGGPRKGQWLFTAGTMTGLDKLYDEFDQKPRATTAKSADFWKNPRYWLRDQVPAPLKRTVFGLQLWLWIGLLAVLLVGVLVQTFAGYLLRGLTHWRLRVANVSIGEQLPYSATRPLAVLAMVGTWWGGIGLLDLGAGVEDTLRPAAKFVLTAVVVWAAFRMTDLLFGFVEARAQRATLRVSALLVPLLRKSLKIVIGAIGAVMIARALGMGEDDVNKILAGLGLFGLAFTLAAQDTIRNFFGAFVAVLDPPFQIGDWVKIGEVEGQVESVGLRSLRIRTMHDSQVTIPNSTLISAAVDNLGARRYRRFQCTISVGAGARPAQLEAFCEGVRELIRRHPRTRKDKFQVWVHQLNADSIDILLTCLFDTREWTVELRERHRLLLDIVRLAHRLGIELAGSTEPANVPVELPEQPDAALQLGRREAEAIVALVGAYMIAEATERK